MQTITQKRKNSLSNVFAISFLILTFLVSNAQVGIGTTTPLSTFEVNGSMGQKLTTVATDATIDDTNSLIICNNGATAITITLPDASAIRGRIYTIKRDDSSTAIVTIVTTSSQLIDGEATCILANAKEVVTVVSDGADWKKLNTNYSAPQNPNGEISYFNIGGTTISVIDTINLVLCNPATTLSSSSFGFSNGGADTGRLEYTGTKTMTFHISGTLSVEKNSDTPETFIFEFKKNGTTDLPNSTVIQKLNIGDTQDIVVNALVTLATDDYLELFVGGISGYGDLTIKSLNLFVQGM